MAKNDVLGPDAIHECAVRPPRVTAELCSALTRIAPRNQFCCASSCTSPFRVCWKCLVTGESEPQRVADFNQGLCRKHLPGYVAEDEPLFIGIRPRTSGSVAIHEEQHRDSTPAKVKVSAASLEPPEHITHFDWDGAKPFARLDMISQGRALGFTIPRLARLWGKNKSVLYQHSAFSKIVLEARAILELEDVSTTSLAHIGRYEPKEQIAAALQIQRDAHREPFWKCATAPEPVAK